MSGLLALCFCALAVTVVTAESSLLSAKQVVVPATEGVSVFSAQTLATPEEQETFASNKSSLYTALVWIHRCLVCFSWGFLFPLGVSLVRFHPSGSRLRLHRIVQCTGLFVETIQFTCIVWAHSVGITGQGPNDGHFASEQGAAPTASHKQIGLVVYLCVLMQLVLGVCRPQPYPNGLKRRSWIWAHRAIGDGALVLAWVQIWQAVKTIADPNVFVAFCIVISMFMLSSAVVTPVYLMMMQTLEAEKAALHDDGSSSPKSNLIDAGQTDEAVEHPAHPRDAMFYGCTHCTQVFADKKHLETHIKFIHPGLEYGEILSPMPQRYAEVTHIPEVAQGVALSEVARHKSRDDCWVVICGKVYDLSAFISIHPGGPNSILSWAGRDATRMWKLIHQVSWIDRDAYKEAVVCKGPLVAEDANEGLRERTAGQQSGVSTLRHLDTSSFYEAG